MGTRHKYGLCHCSHCLEQVPEARIECSTIDEAKCSLTTAVAHSVFESIGEVEGVEPEIDGAEVVS